MKRLIALLAVGLISTAAPVSAVQMNFTLQGEITAAAMGNTFGLGIGDTLNLSGMFDATGLTGTGFESIEFGADDSNMFTLSIGAVAIDNTMDVDFLGGGKPVLSLQDGAFFSLDWILQASTNSAPLNFVSLSSEASFQSLDDMGQIVFNGRWANFTATEKTVPEPLSAVLFGLGLLVLLFLQRFRRNALVHA